MSKALGLMAAVALALVAAPVRPAEGQPPAAAPAQVADDVDPASPVTLYGVVTSVTWANPNSMITLTVTRATPDGAPLGAWLVRGGTPNTMVRMGLDKNVLTAGAHLIVQGYRFKDVNCAQACKVAARTISFPPCGRFVGMGSSGGVTTQEAYDRCMAEIFGAPTGGDAGGDHRDP